MNNFEDIYLNRVWGFEDSETLSGNGSTKSNNIFRNVFIARFINTNNIKIVYDICGDCNWQHGFVNLVLNNDFKYIGFDVSKTALDIAKKKNYGNSLNFTKDTFDLCSQKIECPSNLQNYSLIIIKEVLQHLPLKNCIQLLKNIKVSGIKYIAVTNHDIDIFNIKNNINIPNIGGFFPNNMFLEPFNFINPLDDISNIFNHKDLEKKYGNLIIFNIQEQEI